jgi:glucosamine--fructose-6-phosphate aminotransferase (isomerizing)
MCGIFGIVSRGNSKVNRFQAKKLLNELFLFSGLRGLEASGFAIKSETQKKIGILRQSIKSSEFIKSTNYLNLVDSFLSNSNLEQGFSIIGHTRIATNGYVSSDNQPILKDKTIGVHNGIICNIDSLWDKYKNLRRKQIIDSELLIGLIRDKVNLNDGKKIPELLFESYSEIEGTASIALLFDKYGSVLLGTNCGSLYYYISDDIFAFASEEYILLNALINVFGLEKKFDIFKLEPTSFALVNETTLKFNLIKQNDFEIAIPLHSPFDIIDFTNEKIKVPFLNNQSKSLIISLLENNIGRIKKLKRCTNCILPETHPFINFDEFGVCNYCRDYKKRRVNLDLISLETLEKELVPIRKLKGNNCIMMLSGGRDSCYALHIVKKELGLNPIAFSYDWGMLTDLGRRNQSRMCEKLGVEHVIVSADIKMKRRNIKLNVEAFLAKPHLGMIGLFMAGDKAYHHFAKEVSDKYNLKLIGGGCPIEHTYFKEGFSDIEPYFMRKRTFWDRLDIIKFFAKQSIYNPRFLNKSIPDNLLAYKYYYMTVLDVIQLFRYLPWEEETVNKTLINEYNWELSPDTPTSWRIGDGTAAFYNYIYYTVAGFTENDCLRSNQILEGVLTREEALGRVELENAPRFDSLKWYCDTIGVNLEYAINQINKIPKLYK